MLSSVTCVLLSCSLSGSISSPVTCVLLSCSPSSKKCPLVFGEVHTVSTTALFFMTTTLLRSSTTFLLSPAALMLCDLFMLAVLISLFLIPEWALTFPNAWKAASTPVSYLIPSKALTIASIAGL
uniref:Secreted protein n=1 Tax=Cacopsylla melanoneura TaxID=428564 RepID=A0A8D8PY08_9HEMI